MLEGNKNPKVWVLGASQAIWCIGGDFNSKIMMVNWNQLNSSALGEVSWHPPSFRREIPCPNHMKWHFVRKSGAWWNITIFYDKQELIWTSMGWLGDPCPFSSPLLWHIYDSWSYMSLLKMNISKVALPEGTVLSQEEVAKHLGWNVVETKCLHWMLMQVLTVKHVFIFFHKDGQRRMYMYIHCTYTLQTEGTFQDQLGSQFSDMILYVGEPYYSSNCVGTRIYRGKSKYF